MALASLAARIPKVHLHCHLEGSLRASTFVELADKHGVPLRYKSDLEGVDPADPYRFETFQEFLYIFAAVSRALREPADFARLAREFVADAIAQNVIYGELFVSPPVWKFFHPELDVRTTLEAIVGELRAARPRAAFKLLPDLTRNFGAANAMTTARVVAQMSDLDVVGVSLGGNEAEFPAGLFVEAFDYARAQGLRCVAHAGEAAGAGSVRAAVELLRAERIGHGIRALEDPRTVELLSAAQIPLEICPTSNRRTGASLAAYPEAFTELDRRGCVVTIDCDDPALFGASIEREYALVERAAGGAALERFVRNAVAATFAEDAAKRAMNAQISAAVAELPVAPRS
jgi:adenosine deaminase